MASAGVGSFPHGFAEVFSSLVGVQLTLVPYRGGGPAMNDILSGQVDLFFEVISTAVPQLQSKRAFALLATGNARSSLLPDVPTASELGYPGLNLTSWTGLAAAAGTPAPIVELLNKEANVVLQSDRMTICWRISASDPSAVVPPNGRAHHPGGGLLQRYHLKPADFRAVSEM